MANTQLILRTLTSPFTTPFNDFTKGSVLSQADVDNNFIYLKGNLIYTASTSGNIVTLYKINGSTIQFNASSGGSGSDVFVTGGTYSSGTATFTNNTGGTFTVTGFTTGDTYVTGVTFNNSTYVLTLGRNDGVNLTSNLSILASDVTITGGTYNPSTGTVTFINNTGGTFNVTGFITGFTDTVTTGGTYNNSTGTATFTNSTGGTFNVTGFTTGGTSGVDVYVTGGTYSSGTTVFKNNTGGTFSVTGFVSANTFTTGATFDGTNIAFNRNDSLSAYTVSLSGLACMAKYSITTGLTSGVTITVTHNLNTTDVIVQVIDAATNQLIYVDIDNYLLNSFDVTSSITLPSVRIVVLACGTQQIGTDIYTTSATLIGNTVYFNRNDALSAYSVTLNDVYVTGGTYNNPTGTATFKNNTGGTFTVTGFTTGSTGGVDVYVTGGTANNSAHTYTFTNNTGGTFTVNGLVDVTVTGGTYAAGTVTFTNNTGGTFSVTGLFTGSTDVYVTGGTLSSGTTTFTNNTGGTFNVTGYSTVSKYSLTTGFTANIALTIPHNLGTNKINVALWDNTSGELIYGTVSNRTTNSVDVKLSSTLVSVDVVII